MGDSVNQLQRTKLLFMCICGNFNKTVGGVHICPQNIHWAVLSWCCRHVFHKSCIDPWLIEHRSCPICKIDILKAFGLQVKEFFHCFITLSDLSACFIAMRPLMAWWYFVYIGMVEWCTVMCIHSNSLTADWFTFSSVDYFFVFFLHCFSF